MTGREFENHVCKKLKEAGYWVLRIPQNETGQQPFDILAIKGKRILAYDAKVLSDGHRFPLDRIEDNQYNAFELMEKKTGAEEIGLLIRCECGVEPTIRFMGIDRIHTETWLGKKSVDVYELPLWRLV
jgi:Holliday junction resolvase